MDKPCTACPYIAEGKSSKIDEKNTWNIEKHMSCNTYNSIYLLECNKRKLYAKIYWNFQAAAQVSPGPSPRLYFKPGAHFNLPGNSLAHLSVTILEQTRNNSENYRKEQEKYFIRRFDTHNNGINWEWQHIVDFKKILKHIVT